MTGEFGTLVGISAGKSALDTFVLSGGVEGVAAGKSAVDVDRLELLATVAGKSALVASKPTCMGGSRTISLHPLPPFLPFFLPFFPLEFVGTNLCSAFPPLPVGVLAAGVGAVFGFLPGICGHSC